MWAFVAGMALGSVIMFVGALMGAAISDSARKSASNETNFFGN